MKNANITYEEFVAYLLKKYVALYSANRLKCQLHNVYDFDDDKGFDKDFIYGALEDFIISDDVIISNVNNSIVGLLRNLPIKQIIIESLLIDTFKKEKGENIFEISAKENNFFWNVSNEYVFSVLLEYAVCEAEKLKNTNKGRLIFVIEPNENINFKDLTILINKVIRKKLPIVFFIWDNGKGSFSEVNSYLKSYGGFFNILSGYPQSKVFFKIIKNNDYLSLFEDIRFGLSQSRKNIPSVFLIDSDSDGGSLDDFRAWLLDNNLVNNIKLEELEKRINNTIVSEVNKSYFEKFLFDICSCFSDKKEWCLPDKGKKFLEKIMFLKREDKLLQEYDFLNKYVNKVGENTPFLLKDKKIKFRHISIKPLDNKFKQVATMMPYLFDDDFFVFEEFPINEFIYLYRELKANIIFYPFPMATVLLKGKSNAKDDLLSCVFEKIEEDKAVMPHDIYLA